VQPQQQPQRLDPSMDGGGPGPLNELQVWGHEGGGGADAARGQPLPLMQIPVNNKNTFGLATQNDEVLDLEVKENVIGAVIGPSGRSIIEMQQFSGARIQISKKGAFSPGTRNRIVTISGPQQSVATAKFLIEKKVREEDARTKY
jgi:polyribonucleotide nucleotidyltransferase